MSNEGLIFLKKYEQDYWQTIEIGSQFLPKGCLPNSLSAVQQVVIYGCADGYLVLRFTEHEGDSLVITQQSTSNWKDLLHEQKLYDENGNETTQRLTLGMRDPNKLNGHMVTLSDVKIRKKALIIRPKWLSATIVVGEPGGGFSDPIEVAKKDIKTFVAAKNLNIRIDADISITSDKVIQRLENLLMQYKQCLLEAKVEEDIQKFIERNPFILNPWGEIFPKFRLGKEYICDFLIEDLAASSFKYVFVEIEPASTNLFHKNKKEVREFRFRLHHGLSQLTDWEIWIRDNMHVIKRQFTEFDQPCFILVIGRGNNLSLSQKKVILNENTQSKSRIILTYNDLDHRLEELINGLRRL